MPPDGSLTLEVVIIYYSLLESMGKIIFKRDIVDIAYSLEELNEKERVWIKNYDAVYSDDYYNMIEGGT